MVSKYIINRNSIATSEMSIMDSI
ncbi:unnamed protein product [Staphylococcus haemolyticus JCSC1435]|uniref:Uncharacterized protein n=1 Tax=Staphylococcus haemolyticus (strain JCSC1435) TaxID=279808 RepID=Q4L3A6_STAHJ|nr:unnamed protein product [Staphylococcus haemolyticus JCSC1435]